MHITLIIAHINNKTSMKIKSNSDLGNVIINFDIQLNKHNKTFFFEYTISGIHNIVTNEIMVEPIPIRTIQ